MIYMLKNPMHETGSLSVALVEIHLLRFLWEQKQYHTWTHIRPLPFSILSSILLVMQTDLEIWNLPMFVSPMTDGTTFLVIKRILQFVVFCLNLMIIVFRNIQNKKMLKRHLFSFGLFFFNFMFGALCQFRYFSACRSKKIEKNCLIQVRI